jgi:hypothetical protein
VRRRPASSSDQARPESIPESGPESAPANRRAVKMATTKSGGVKTASTKAATSVETTAAETAAETAVEAAAAATTTRRHNVGCKHSKCCSRQQRDRDFTEHDQPSLVPENDGSIACSWPLG